MTEQPSETCPNCAQVESQEEMAAITDMLQRRNTALEIELAALREALRQAAVAMENTSKNLKRELHSTSLEADDLAMSARKARALLVQSLTELEEIAEPEEES